MQAQRSQRGFTIVEMMVTILIAGVLVTFALPAFNDMLARRRLQGQANELVTDLAYAKSESVQRNRNVLVQTDPSGTTCYVVAVMPDPPAGSCNCAGCTGGPTALKTVTLTGGVGVTTNRLITFEPIRGTANANSISVQNSSTTYTVSVAANGRITPFTQ